MILRLYVLCIALVAVVVISTLVIFNYLFDITNVNVNIKPSPGLNALCVTIDKSHEIKTPGKFEVLGTLIKIDDFYVKICKNNSENTSNE